jgi:hypothetical protein
MDSQPPPPLPEPAELHELRAQLEKLEKYELTLPDAALDKMHELRDQIAAWKAKLRPPPPRIPPPPDLTPAEWADGILADVAAWIERRKQQRVPYASRFASEAVNTPGHFDLQEVGPGRRPGPYWYFLSVLDLYDLVWHCRRCWSSSDVWMRTEYRPPEACPNCGYGGPDRERSMDWK